MSSKKAMGHEYTEAEQAVKKALKPMTDEEYVKESGSCPYCRSGEIEGGPITIEGGGAWQQVSCTVCDKTWSDSYMLTGYLGEKVSDDHEIAGQDKVTIEVTGGVAEVTSCSPGVTVEIIDHDNEAAQVPAKASPASSRPPCPPCLRGEKEGV